MGLLKAMGMDPSLLSENGIVKLSNFISDLEALKTKLEAGELADEYIPVSSTYSIKTLNDLIALSQDMKNHSNTSYWNSTSQKLRLEDFFRHFDGNMHNFSPACFDILSYEMAKIYQKLLKSIHFSEVLTKAASSLIPFDKLQSHATKNTEQLIQLFEFASNSVREKEAAESSSCKEELQLSDLIQATQEELLNVQRDENTSLIIADIINNYEKKIEPLFVQFLNTQLPEVSVYGLSEGLKLYENDDIKGSTVFIGRVLGAEPMKVRPPCNIAATEPPDVFSTVALMSGEKGYLLRTLLQKERQLLEIIKDHNMIVNGIIAKTKANFKFAEYANLFEQLKTFARDEQKKLTTYLQSNAWFLFIKKKSVNKLELAKHVLECIDDILKPVSYSRTYHSVLNDLFKLFMKVSAFHNVIIGDEGIAHGELGDLLTDALGELYQKVQSVRLNTTPELLIDVLKREEYLQLLNPNLTNHVSPLEAGMFGRGSMRTQSITETPAQSGEKSEPQNGLALKMPG